MSNRATDLGRPWWMDSKDARPRAAAPETSLNVAGAISYFNPYRQVSSVAEFGKGVPEVVMTGVHISTMPARGCMVTKRVNLLSNTRMILKVHLGMVCLVALHIIATDAICTSNESSALHCSHMVTPDITNDTCLNSSIPCCDIGTYIKYSSFTSNTTFCFLNGTHIIDLVEIPMLRIENVSNISLIGLGSLMHHSLQDKIFIDNSSAGIAGNVLYGGNVEECNFDCSTAPHYCDPNTYISLLDILYATATLGQNNGNQSAMISSDATGVFHCVNDSAVFDTPLPISAYPGKKVNISIITIGQLHGASPDIVTYLTCLIPNTNANCTTPSLKTTDLQPTHLYCTNYTYLVTGNWNKTYSMLLNLILASAYLGKIDISPYQVTVNINQCPFGFRNWSDIMSICSAEDILVNYHIANDVQTSTVLRNNTMWIGNSSSNTSLAVHLHCPYDYCNPSSITFRITDEQDNQCNYNRTGVLCGRCKTSMSSVFGSNRCVPCADKLWLLVPFSIMGVALVALLFLLNFTVSVGTINGLILRNAVAVLATLILLSYTKILQTVITVFAFTEIDAGNSTANNPPVWLADGTVFSMDTGKITLECILLD
eukprot:Em0014g825a